MNKLLAGIDWFVKKYLHWRNLVVVQETHCDDPGFHKWHHQNKW
jgi:hypothetical protein